MTQTDRLVSVKETAAAYGLSVASVWRRVSDGTIPKPIKIGGSTRWSEAEIAAHIEQAKSEREAA